MGVDTVKLSYDLRAASPRASWWLHHPEGAPTGGWSRGRHYGSVGPVNWWAVEHPEGIKLTVKQCGREAFALFEASVPKTLGVCGPSDPQHVALVDRWIRELAPGLPNPAIRRLDLTHDEYDPDGVLRRAALGWKPHARARYVQAEYQDGETVWLHNKSRGVRVYDKFEESKESWALDLTRIEYQVRGDWCGKLGFDRIHDRLPEYVDRALSPLVSDLKGRV